MSTENVIPLRPVGCRFDEIYDGMQAELNALRCAIAALQETDWERDECSTAGVLLLVRTFKALDELHAELAEVWERVKVEHEGAQP
jgi:hypothetical protein